MKCAVFDCSRDTDSDRGFDRGLCHSCARLVFYGDSDETGQTRLWRAMNTHEPLMEALEGLYELVSMPGELETLIPDEHYSKVTAAATALALARGEQP